MGDQLGLFDLPPSPAAAVISSASNEGGKVITPSLPMVRACVPSPAAGPVLHDGECRLAIAANRNMLVPWYLIASWAYYVGDRPLISDALFDRLCRNLAASWPEVEHRHKHLVDPGWLAAGTCLLAREAYPAPVRGAAAHLAWTGSGVRLPRE